MTLDQFILQNGKASLKIETFDIILLDPPCSGFGQRPVFKNECIEDQFESISTYQAKLFKTAISLLKPGGFLLYSTCTMNPLENEILVNDMLNLYKDGIELYPIDFAIGESGIPGLIKEHFKVKRFWPDGIDDTNGFFIALIRKI